jgi:acetyl-CoA carboxylase biotin carboxyl carrier protein
MDIKQIQELVKLMNKTSIGEITIEEDGKKITIKQKNDPVQQIVAAPVHAPMAQAPVHAAVPAAAPAAPAGPAAEKAGADNYITIKSPMIGTFYRQAGPGKPIFASVGDEVAPGKVVCIIEAMKLFNEIECEVKGRIVKVLVEDASPVEFDQPLFLVEPA